jgi:hypothetical protein
VQETVFRGELDIAWPKTGAAADRPVEAARQGRGELKVRRGAIVEINAGLTGRSIARVGSGVECIDLEMLVIRGLRIVRDIGRTGERGLRQHRHK